MTGDLGSLLPSTLLLGAAALAALYLTLTRGWADESDARLRGTVQVAAVTVLVQAGHFAEELATGLRERLPALFDQDPMSAWFFVTFNLAWLVIWSLSVWGLAARRRVALFPLWFLGIAGVGNGLAHPMMAVTAGGYFPGLLTAPLVGVLAFLLMRRLLGLTAPGAVTT
jgi:hypothetical protein